MNAKDFDELALRIGVSVLGGWLFMSSCVHRNDAWKHLNTRELGCTPFEIVIAEGVEYRVVTIAGVVYALGAPDGTASVEGVRVVLRRLGGREELAATTTDSRGRFEFPGFRRADTRSRLASRGSTPSWSLCGSHGTRGKGLWSYA